MWYVCVRQRQVADRMKCVPPENSVNSRPAWYLDPQSFQLHLSVATGSLLGQKLVDHTGIIDRASRTIALGTFGKELCFIISRDTPQYFSRIRWATPLFIECARFMHSELVSEVKENGKLSTINLGIEWLMMLGVAWVSDTCLPLCTLQLEFYLVKEW